MGKQTFTIRCIAYLTLYLLLVVPAAAQEATPAPWPPNPDDIFTSQISVEVIPDEPINTTIEQNDQCGFSTQLGETWHYYADPETGRIRFCEATSGKMTDPLPIDINYWDGYGSTRGPSTSPDGTWLIFWGIEKSERGVNFYVLYSYNVHDGEFNRLGTVRHEFFREDVQISNWLDNTHGSVRQGGGPEIAGSALFSFDVESAERLQFIFSGWFDYDDKARRYTYLETREFLEWKTGSIIEDDVTCVLSVFDLRGAREYELGHDCLPMQVTDVLINEYTIHAGDTYFYLPSDPNDGDDILKIAAINVSNDQISDIFYGDAQLLSVSPNGDYLVLILEHSSLAIYDIERQTIIYVNEYFEEKAYPSLPYTFDWIDDRTLLMFLSGKMIPISLGNGREVIKVSSPSSIRLVAITDDEQVTAQAIYGAELPYPKSLSPDKQWILAGNDVYELATGMKIALFTEHANPYYISVDWIDNHRLKAVIGSQDRYGLKPVSYRLSIE